MHRTNSIVFSGGELFASNSRITYHNISNGYLVQQFVFYTYSGNIAVFV